MSHLIIIWALFDFNPGSVRRSKRGWLVNSSAVSFRIITLFQKSCQLQQPNPVNPVNNDESEGRGNRMGKAESSLKTMCSNIWTSCFLHYVIMRWFEDVSDLPDGVTESTWHLIGQLMHFGRCSRKRLFEWNPSFLMSEVPLEDELFTGSCMK